MPNGLLNCAHCDGAPLFVAGRLQAVIVCEECGISTPPVRLDAAVDSDFAFVQLSATWNRREVARPADEQTISLLARRALTPADLPYFLNLLAATSDDWPTNGPRFAAMAAALAQPTHQAISLDPPATVMEDAYRYRKLVRRARIIHVDGAPVVRFEHVPALAAAVAEEDTACDRPIFASFEAFVARAVDAIPETPES